MDIQKIRTLLGLSADRPLSPGGKTQGVPGILFIPPCVPALAGSLWLIYSPLEDSIRIFPPGQQRMDGNKVDAYEREELEKRISTVKMHFRRWLRFVRQFR